MTNIAILGSGRVSHTLAPALLGAGHQVLIGSRDAGSAQAEWTDSGVTVTDVADAAARADVVVNATPGDSSVERLGGLRAQLAGKVLLDVANASARGDDGMPIGLLYPGESLGERLQSALPETKVVKALNTMLFLVMGAPDSLSAPVTAFLSGDDEDAKQVVIGLLNDLGWKADQILDLGGIRSARAPEAAVEIVPAVLKSRGMVPFAITVVG